MQRSVLFILTSLGGGGAEKVFIDLLRNFDYNKYKITVLLVYGAGVHLSNIPKEVELISLFNRPQKQLDISVELYLRPIYHELLKYKTKKVIGNRCFDVIVSYTEGFPVLLHSFIENKKSKRVAWVHTDMNVKHWCWWHFRSLKQETELYRKMDDIVVVSKKAKDGFIQLFGLKDNLSVIYNIIDKDNIIIKSKSEKIIKRKFTICHVGRLNPVKRQERIIHVANELKQRGYDFEVWILGEGQCEKELKALVSKLDLFNTVKFLGYKNNPYPYIASSDIFILTSDTEGYPTVVCESLCLGVPVVSTNITGSNEILEDGYGILTSFDIAEITDRIEELMNNPKLYDYYANMAIKKSMQFNTDNVIKQIMKVLD